MNRTKLIQHYKAFFKLEDMELSEDDHLIIDWAESLLKDNQNEELKDRGIAVVGSVDQNYEAIKRMIEVLDINEESGETIAIVGTKQRYSEVIEKLEIRDTTNIVNLLEDAPIIERPNKRENKNRKGRNSHRYGRKPSKF